MLDSAQADRVHIIHDFFTELVICYFLVLSRDSISIGMFS